MRSLLVLRREGTERIGYLEAVVGEFDNLVPLALGLLGFPHGVELLVGVLWRDGGDRADLMEILDRCAAMSWGSELGLAVLSGDRVLETVREASASARLWVESVLDRGVSRLVEVSPEMWNGSHPAHIPGELLRRHLDRFTENQERALALLGGRNGVVWRTRSSSYILNALLQFETPSFPETAEVAKILVVDVPTGRRQVRFFEENFSGGEFIVLATLRCVERKELREARESRGLQLPLAFETELEMLFFAAWLRRRLAPGSSECRPRHVVLITNSFLESEPGLACAASGDIAAVRRLLSAEDHLIVERHLTSTRLLDRLAEVPTEMHSSPLIWIHLGHGEEDGSLRESQGSSIPIEQCVNIFTGSGMRLKAALLLACNTMELARSLAAVLRSIQLATGFVGEVPNAECRDLIRCLLPGLLSPDQAELAVAWNRLENVVAARGAEVLAVRFPQSL